MLPFLLDQPTHLVNWASPLNQGLVSWWLAMSGRMGGGTWFDLCGLRPSPVDLSLGYWGGSSRPGGNAILRTGTGLGTQTVSGNVSLNMATNEFTVGSWIYMSKVISGGSVTVNFAFRWSLSVSDTAITFNSSVGKAKLTTAIADGWYHVVGVLDASNAILYVNGLPVATTARTGSYSQSVQDLSWRVQNYSAGWDDTRIHFRPFSAGQVAELYRDSYQGNPRTINRYRRPLVFDTGGGGGGGGLSIPIALYHYQHHFAA